MILLQQILSVQDINDAARLANGIWHEHFTPIIGEKQVDYMLDRFQSAPAIAEQIRQGYLYFALILDHRQIGYVAFRIDDDALFLSKLYIQKEFRGRGFSHTVITYAEKLAREQAKPVIRLTCNKNNVSSLAIYKKIGFEIVREEKADIGSGFFMDDYILEKQI
ncbi:MAG: GNAT family N-acetyltransferase [Alphaproteobacteria bacterium]|nr:GNAT family N-acetyltransferase [Alphaproteobacteria bacterium]